MFAREKKIPEWQWYRSERPGLPGIDPPPELGGRNPDQAINPERRARPGCVAWRSACAVAVWLAQRLQCRPGWRAVKVHLVQCRHEGAGKYDQAWADAPAGFWPPLCEIRASQCLRVLPLSFYGVPSTQFGTRFFTSSGSPSGWSFTPMARARDRHIGLPSTWIGSKPYARYSARMLS
jgi:hypothetical protein